MTNTLKNLYYQVLKNNLDFWEKSIKENHDPYWTNIIHETENIQYSLETAESDHIFIEEKLKLLIILEPMIKSCGAHQNWLPYYSKLLSSDSHNMLNEKFTKLSADITYDIQFQPAKGDIPKIPKPEYYKKLTLIFLEISIGNYSRAFNQIAGLKSSLLDFELIKRIHLTVLTSFCQAGLNDFRKTLINMDYAAKLSSTLEFNSLQFRVRYIQAYLLYRLGYGNQAIYLWSSLINSAFPDGFVTMASLTKNLIDETFENISHHDLSAPLASIIKSLFFSEDKNSLPIQTLCNLLFQLP